MVGVGVAPLAQVHQVASSGGLARQAAVALEPCTLASATAGQKVAASLRWSVNFTGLKFPYYKGSTRLSFHRPDKRAGPVCAVFCGQGQAASTKSRICSGTRTKGRWSNSCHWLSILRRVAAALLRGLESAFRHFFAAEPHTCSLQNFARLLLLVSARPQVRQRRAAVVGRSSSSAVTLEPGTAADHRPRLQRQQQ